MEERRKVNERREKEIPVGNEQRDRQILGNECVLSTEREMCLY